MATKEQKPEDKKQDFYDVAGMTRRFNEAVNPAQFAQTNMTVGQYWFVVSTLAVAQQLTLVNKHLGRIADSLASHDKEPGLG